MALQAERLKHSNCTALEAKFLFMPVVVEMSEVFGFGGSEFLHELGSRMARISLEPTSFQYLVQRISVTVQRGNSVAVLGTVVKDSGLNVISLYE